MEIKIERKRKGIERWGLSMAGVRVRAMAMARPISLEERERERDSMGTLAGRGGFALR